MHRRDFTALAVALGLAPTLGEIAYAQASSGARVRKDAAAQAAAGDVSAYRKGVAALKANTKATDYDSWMYWANSHGMPGAVPPSMAKVWYRCQHGTSHFLTWHRAYLYFFEVLIREKSGEDGFALPYWNWFASKALPAAFASPEVEGQPNALFHANRSFRDRTLLPSALTRQSFFDFASTLEGNPHGTVHVMVSGDMGNVETSARDPIFWLHHCNVDRMWSVWQQQSASHKNPTDSTWLAEAFAFDVAQMKNKKVSDLLETANSLYYTYDSVSPTGGPVAPVPTRPPSAIEVPLAQGSSFLSSQPLAKPMTVSKKTPIALKGGTVSLNFAVPGGASGRMETMSVPTSAKSPTLTLVLKDVRATPAGIRRGAEYRVYLNLPRERKDEYKHDDFYLGSFNTFALSHHKGAHPTTLTFSLSSLAPTLSRIGLWSNSRVSVSLLSDDTESPEPLVLIGDVQLQLSDAPLK